MVEKFSKKDLLTTEIGRNMAYYAEYVKFAEDKILQSYIKRDHANKEMVRGYEKYRRKRLRQTKTYRNRVRRFREKEQAKYYGEVNKYLICIAENDLIGRVLKEFNRPKTALSYYNMLVDYNHKNISIPIRTKYNYETKNVEEVKYSILVLKTVDSDEDRISILRNEHGEFVEHAINSETKYRIERRDSWFVNRTYSVSNSDTKDGYIRMTANQIKDNIILSDIGDHKFKRVFTYKRFVFVEVGDRHRVISCPNEETCTELYNYLWDNIKHKKVYFTSEVSQRFINNIKTIIEKETGYSSIEFSDAF